MALEQGCEKRERALKRLRFGAQFAQALIEQRNEYDGG